MEHDPSRDSGYATTTISSCASASSSSSSSSNSIVVENLFERYVPINDFLKGPTDEILDLDVAYRISMQQLMTAKRMLRRKNLSKDKVNELLDRVEDELVIAQRIAFWKRDVLLTVDKQLFTLTGRKSKPKIEKVVVSKPKVRTKKMVAAAIKENLRRSERERKSPCIVKAKDNKEIPTTTTTTVATVLTTPDTNVQLTCRTKRKAKESESGADSGSTSSSTKKRTSGRLVKPGNRKKQLNNNNNNSTLVANNTSTTPAPDEPTYCLCEQISFGEMIGCDNEKCLVEWFHFECVQLKVKPKGKWYCPMCRGDRFNVLKSSLAR